MAEMKRGRSQVLYNYTPKSLFRFNETRAWCEVTSIEMRNTQELPTALGEALGAVLETWDAIQPDNYPDPVLFPGKYEVGEPYQVRYTLRPLVFLCKRCKRVQYYSDVDTLTKFNYNLKCRKCQQNDAFVQIPYIFIHECGRDSNIPVPGHDRDHDIVMINTGRFLDSYWVCNTCKKALTTPGKTGLGFRNCQCGPKKPQRGTTLQDPSVQYPRTISLVDTQDAILERARENPHLGETLLSGLVRTAHYNAADFKELLTPSPHAEDTANKKEQMRQELIAKGIADPQQLDMILGVMQTQLLSPQVEKQQRLHEDIQSLTSLTPNLEKEAAESRPLLEYLFVRDHPRMQSRTLETLWTEAQAESDSLATATYATDRITAEELGLAHPAVIEAFPLLLAAVGYSRVYASPQSEAAATPVVLRPFVSDRPKIPIYAIRNTTEALMVELDPWWEAAWLAENRLAELPRVPFRDEPQLRTWLLQQRQSFLANKEEHLVLLPWEKDKGIQVARTPAALFGLLHSLSHMLIVAATTQVGFEADSLGEYLFPIASASVIYASGHQ